MRHHCSVFIFILTVLFCAPGLACAATDYTNTVSQDTPGTYNVSSDSAITTGNVDRPGMHAVNPGSVISADDRIKIKTTGDESYGASAQTGGRILIGGSVDITTSGSSAYGVYALDLLPEDDTGGYIKVGDGAKITTSGEYSRGAYAMHNSSIDIGDFAVITTSGREAYGLWANSNSYIKIGDSATITTLHAVGTGSEYGVTAESDSSIDIGNSVKITTYGGLAHGVFVYTGSNIQIGKSADITTEGPRSHGAASGINSNMTIGNGATIRTLSNDANAVYAYRVSNVTVGNSAKISTSGAYAHGAYAYLLSTVNIGGGSSITTLGDYAYGAFAYTISSIDIGSEAKIKTLGYMSHGAYAYNGAYISIDNSADITTEGESAHAAYAQMGSTIDISEGAAITTTGTGAHAVYANGSDIRLNGGTISATGTDANAIQADNGNATVTGSGVFNITGDMYAEATYGATNTVIDLTLENGSLFTGRTSYSTMSAPTDINLTLNGADTQWILTGNSYLTNLYMDDATVDLTQAFGLYLNTINLGRDGNDSGTFIMETHIVDEEADLLIITGEAKGHYVIDVLNSGSDASLGTEITDLVLIMEPGQTATFELDHEVECGGWQFALHAPDRDPSRLAPRAVHQPEAFYLYATGRASTAGSGAINSFAGSYLMTYAETNTLMQRMGDLRDSEYMSGLWFRVHGGKFESNAKSYVRGFDMKYGGVQIGYDRKLENKWDGDIYAGVMFGYSKGDLDYSSEGSGGVDSKTLGVYGVYVRPDGFYIDTVLKYQWMTNDFDVIDTAGTLVRGNDVDTGGLGFSVEVGRRIPFSGTQKSGWYAEPQIQLSYQLQDGGYFNATNGLNIGVDSFTSLLGRVGMLVGYETEKSNFYAKVSKVKEFDGDLTIHANGVPIAESFGDNWWVYGLGFTSRVSDRNSLHLDIERTSGGSFSQPWRINAGWRMEM